VRGWRATTALALALVVPWVAWAAIRTFGLEGDTALVPLMTFTPYMGLASLLPLLVALVLRRWAVATLAAAVVVAFAVALLPRAIAGPQTAVPDGVTVRVMASNLYVGTADPRAVVDLVRRERVDVLALEELTPEEVERLDAAGLGRVLPHRQYDPGGGGAAGSGLYSRRPIATLPPVNADPHQGAPRGLIRIAGALPIDLQVIHPLPPTTADWRRRWQAMLAALPKATPARGRPLRMLAGDFNATLDHAALRRLLGGDDGYVDAGDATGDGYHTTWPAGRRFPPEITIDHVLVDPRVRVDELSVHTVARSDHRAVVATLVLPRR
jgi:endonuclease/exonuclease/phosphatase family metal-dependent hydrolase